MPNWCSSSITFYSTNEKQLRQLHKDFRAIRDGKPTQENGFGHGWMGDYANHYYKEIGAEKINCRGAVNEIEDVLQMKKNSKVYHYFHMTTTTAWSSKVELWAHIIKDNYEDVDIAFVAEEGGNELYEKFDPNDFFYSSEQYIMNASYPQKDEDGEIHFEWDSLYAKDINDIHNFFHEASLPFLYQEFDTIKKIKQYLEARFKTYTDDEDEGYVSIYSYYEYDPFEGDFRR